MGSIQNIFALDLTAVPIRPTGIGVYSLNLAKHLSDYSQSLPAIKFIVFVQEGLSSRDELKDVEKIICPDMSKMQRIFWELFTLPKLVKSNNISLLHSPNYSTPILGNCKKVTTIHDLTSFLFPKRRKFIHGLYSRLIMKVTAQFSDSIISVSKNTTADIKSILPLKSTTSVNTVYQGRNELYRLIPAGENECASVFHKHSITRPFFLFVSTIETSKNIDRLADAFLKFSAIHNYIPELLVIGKKGWGCDHFWKLLHSHVGASVIRYLGYVSDEELVSLYNASLALVYPSLYEGFGIPPLEAMACGTPVIASNISSIPEVVGDAGLLVDPYSEDEITRALIMIYESPELREILRNKGLVQAEKFSWKISAVEHFKVYSQIMSGSHLNISKGKR